MAVIGFGAKLSYDPGTGTFTQVADVLSIDPPEVKTNMVDVSNLNMPDRTKRYIPGLIEPGMVTFKALYTKAGYNTLRGLVGIDVVGTVAVRWKVELPDEDGAGAATALSYTFAGTLMQLKHSTLEVESRVEMDGVIQLSGGITVA